MTTAVHFVGSVIPLRGFASLAVDLGIPGAAFILEVLTRKVVLICFSVCTKLGTNLRELQIPNDSDYRRRYEFQDVTETEEVHSPWREEMLSLVGAALVRHNKSAFDTTPSHLFCFFQGEQECLLRLACLSGQRFSMISGLSSLTVVLSSIIDADTFSASSAFGALKDSLMYSDDCSRYRCTIQ